VGTITEIICYLNAEIHPTAQDIKHKYTHIEIDEHIKVIRKEYRKALKLIDKEKKDENIL